MSLLRFCPLLAGLVFSAQLATARVKLPAVLGDHMVLQQQSDVNLWGEAKEGSQVVIKQLGTPLQNHEDAYVSQCKAR